MSELSSALRALSGARFSTAIQQVDYPIHRGQPNPAHGKFFFVGSIPANCYDTTRNGGAGGSRFYDTVDLAIDAAIDGGATHIQRPDCSKVDIAAHLAQRAA